MTAMQENADRLPIRSDLTLIYISTITIAILMAAVSSAGLLYQSFIYPTEELRRDLVSLDVVSLCLGLPILLGSMWLARREKLVGLLSWPGALFFVLYTYLIYVFAMPFNAAFLFDLMLVTLSLYTLLSLVSRIDGEAARQRLTGVVHEKIAGVLLAGQGLLNFIWVIGVLVNALMSGTSLAAGALANHITDVLITPAWVIGGLLLWRRHTLGYVTGLGLLLQGSMFIVAAAIISLSRQFISPAPLTLVKAFVILCGGLLCFIPLALYARGVVSRRMT